MWRRCCCARRRDTADVVELLSLHFLLADQSAETWTYSVLAGERAKAKFANVDAAEFLRRALVRCADAAFALAR